MENLTKIEGEYTPDTTYKIKVGCGNLYIIICHDEKKRFRRLFIPRNSKFYCPLTTRDGLARMATFQGKRNMRQLIRDLRGSKAHHCDKYSVAAEATSCFDGVSKVLEKWQKLKRKRTSKSDPRVSPLTVKVSP
jgi:hypothetical protein